MYLTPIAEILAPSVLMVSTTSYTIIGTLFDARLADKITLVVVLTPAAAADNLSVQPVGALTETPDAESTFDIGEPIEINAPTAGSVRFSVPIDLNANWHPFIGLKALNVTTAGGRVRIEAHGRRWVRETEGAFPQFPPFSPPGSSPPAPIAPDPITVPSEPRRPIRDLFDIF